MLTEYDIDKLMQSIQIGKDTYVYYVAHNTECRQGQINEATFKSVPAFRVIKVKIRNITNALFEYYNYLETPTSYHTEIEETYPDSHSKYIFYYVVPNLKESYEKDINPRMPSMIYGYKRICYRGGVIEKDYVDPSPIDEVYTNALSYGDFNANEINIAFESKKLDWKYKKLPESIQVDEVLYGYVTSDWYILDLENFPRVEMPLINVKQKTEFFMTNEEAQYFREQLEA